MRPKSSLFRDIPRHVCSKCNIHHPIHVNVEPLVAIVDLIRACACVAAQILFHHITTVMDAYCDGRQSIDLIAHLGNIMFGDSNGDSPIHPSKSKANVACTCM